MLRIRLVRQLKQQPAKRERVCCRAAALSGPTGRRPGRHRLHPSQNWSQLVSHDDENTIRIVCDRAIIIVKTSVVAEGAPHDMANFIISPCFARRAKRSPSWTRRFGSTWLGQRRLRRRLSTCKRSFGLIMPQDRKTLAPGAKIVPLPRNRPSPR